MGAMACGGDFDDWHEPACERCKCCGMYWVDCETCGADGYSGHDCGEDTCCCLHPEENMRCDVCEGTGGWWTCSCDANGKHVESKGERQP